MNKHSSTFILSLLLFVPLLPPSANAETTSRGEAVIGSNLDLAKQRFQATSTLPRRDCDPVGDGRWICASYNNPQIEDFLTSGTGRYSGEPVAVSGRSLDEAKQRFLQQTILARVDCDPFGANWICASFNNPTPYDLHASDNIPQSEEIGDLRQPASGSTAPTPATRPAESLLPQTNNTNRQASGVIPDDALRKPGDLLVLNYDSCPDPDDLHAAVAGKMVLDFYGLEFGEDYIVTNGTCGDLRSRSDYITSSAIVFNELYGNRWYDAYFFEDQSISSVGDAIRERLEAGYRVWVLDGGPMDFTARVIAYIAGIGTSDDLKDITVIQHSHGWNEEHTSPANLNYMRANVRYLKIDNGNHTNNRTPQLNQSNQQQAFPDVDLDLVDRYLADPVYSTAWQLAFDKLSTEHRFDGSDTVELLWALGLDSTDLRDWYDFADLFIDARQSPGNAGISAELDNATAIDTETVDASQSITSDILDSTFSSDLNSGQVNSVGENIATIEPSSPAGTAEHATSLESAPTQQNSGVAQPLVFLSPLVVRMEAELAVLGDGWVVETSRTDFSGPGYIRWTGANNYTAGGSGITSYTVTPEVSGLHTLSIRARAIDPPRYDLHNDVWIRMNGSPATASSDLTEWVKVFTTGQDSWQVGGTVDDNHSMSLFRQYLQAGRTYTIEISGRSTNYAIDYLLLSADGL